MLYHNNFLQPSTHHRKEKVSEMIEYRQEVSKDLEKALQARECQQIISKIKSESQEELMK